MFHKCAQLLWSQDPHPSDANGHVFNSRLGQLSVFGVTQNMTGENLHLESRSGFIFLLCQLRAAPCTSVSLLFSSLKMGPVMAAPVSLGEAPRVCRIAAAPSLYHRTGSESKPSPCQGRWPQLKQPHAGPCHLWLPRGFVAGAGERATAGLQASHSVPRFSRNNPNPLCSLTTHATDQRQEIKQGCPEGPLPPRLSQWVAS